jgi:hypothetical protein
MTASCWQPGAFRRGGQGTQRLALQRFAAVRAMGLPLHYLRLTAGGHPEHPLYLPAGLTPHPWPASL